jgi:DnaJ family protein A protein 5
MRMTTANDLTRMMGKFRGNVDFSDSPNGFFGYVRETFQELAKEEEYAADYEDINVPDYPTFGHKDDTHDDVVREFYSAWNGFSTVKSFAWMDRYRLSDAPDRRTRRLMEKENQKFRDDGRREFNEAVRTLVAFVRKRDPRYTPNTQSADEKAKAQRDARKAQAARARAAQMAKLEEEAQALPSWATARHESDEEEETEEEVEEDVYECVACNKTFKSEKQWDAHERSKKHQKAIQSLKRKMQKDNAHLDLDKDAINSDVITPADDDPGVDVSASDTNGLDDSTQDLTGKTGELNVEDDGADETEGKENIVSEPRIAPGVGSASEDDEDDEDDEYASRSDIEARLNGLASTNASTHVETPTTDDALLDESIPKPDDAIPDVPKIGKAKLKKARRAAKQAENVDTDSSIKCAGCDASFSSKTKLHQHLDEHPKHAALKSVPGGKGKKKGKR